MKIVTIKSLEILDESGKVIQRPGIVMRVSRSFGKKLVEDIKSHVYCSKKVFKAAREKRYL